MQKCEDYFGKPLIEMWSISKQKGWPEKSVKTYFLSQFRSKSDMFQDKQTIPEQCFYSDLKCTSLQSDVTLYTTLCCDVSVMIWLKIRW